MRSSAPVRMAAAATCRPLAAWDMVRDAGTHGPEVAPAAYLAAAVDRQGPVYVNMVRDACRRRDAAPTFLLRLSLLRVEIFRQEFDFLRSVSERAGKQRAVLCRQRLELLRVDTARVKVQSRLV